MFCTTNLCCSSVHWLFSAWVADKIKQWVPLTFTLFQPPPLHFWYRVMDRRKGKYMSQFCCAHHLGRIRTGFPLQHCAILSSSMSEGLSQVAIQWSHNLQVYLHLCFVVQYFQHIFHFTCRYDLLRSYIIYLFWTSNWSLHHPWHKQASSRLLIKASSMCCLIAHQESSRKPLHWLMRGLFTRYIADRCFGAEGWLEAVCPC